MGIGRSKPLKEVLREQKRQITRAVREMEREQRGLEKQENQLKKDIKKACEAGQMKSVKIMAKDLIRTKNYITRFIEMKSHLQGVSLQLQTVKSHEALASAMRSVSKAMVRMNKEVKVPQLNKIMQDFVRENERAELTGELLGDLIDDTLAGENDEEEEEKVVSQVLAELNIDTAGILDEAPTSLPAAAEAGEEKTAAAVGVGSGGNNNNNNPPPPGGGGGGGGGGMAELEARLNNLRR